MLFLKLNRDNYYVGVLFYNSKWKKMKVVYHIEDDLGRSILTYLPWAKDSKLIEASVDCYIKTIEEQKKIGYDKCYFFRSLTEEIKIHKWLKNDVSGP